MKATLVKRLSGYVGDARLYKIDPPVSYKEWHYQTGVREKITDYVIVSAARPLGQPETYIFPATPEGEVRDWGELPGSYKGELNHEKALKNAGYELA